MKLHGQPRAGRASRFQKRGKRADLIFTRMTALVAAPTGVADRCGRGTWRDIVESCADGVEEEKEES
jgi:hypothetical protein